VRIRVEHNANQKYISTSLKVDPEKWRGGKVTRGHRQADRINSRLRELQSIAQDELTKLRTSGKYISAQRLKTKISDALSPNKDEDAPTFLQYGFKRVREEYEHEGTRKNHLSGLRKLRTYLRRQERENIGIEDLSPADLEGAMRWEREEKGNSQNTVHKTMRSVRRVCQMAMRDGYMSRDDYPFDAVTLTRSRTEKTPLSESEIEVLERRLEQAEAGKVSWPRGGTTAMHALRSWLFAYYMMGMRWSDICTLEWVSVEGGRLRYEQRKGQRTVVQTPRVVEPAQNVLDAYQYRQGNHRFVFPFLDRAEQRGSVDLTDENEVSKQINLRTSRVNQQLRELADRVGINKPLSTHVARHSFAERALSEGWSLRELQKALGHADVTTTQAYIRTLQDDELDDQHEELF
jgi:site-specific recombinase XerD